MVVPGQGGPLGRAVVRGTAVEEFKLKASADARERLILHHAPLVKSDRSRASPSRASAGAEREQAGPPADEAIHNLVNHGPLAHPAG